MFGRSNTADGVERNEPRAASALSATLLLALELEVDGVSLPHLTSRRVQLESAHRAVSTVDNYARRDFRSMRAGKEVRRALILRKWSAKGVWAEVVG